MTDRFLDRVTHKIDEDVQNKILLNCLKSYPGPCNCFELAEDRDKIIANAAYLRGKGMLSTTPYDTSLNLVSDNHIESLLKEGYYILTSNGIDRACSINDSLSTLI